MTKKMRLAIAANKLNQWEWDYYLGDKPEGWDDLPNWSKEGKNDKCKLVGPMIDDIERQVGEWRTSWAHWKYNLYSDFFKWLWWYNTAHRKFTKMIMKKF